MPYQCALSWREFQVVNVFAQGKKWLLNRCRPKRCPYCGSYHTLIGHEYVERYIILPTLETVLLIIPRVICLHCNHTIRVLPIELHSHCNHVGETIRDLIAWKLETGRYTGRKNIPKSLQRHWYNQYLKRCQEYINLRDKVDIKILIKRLPSFSILFRNHYRTVRENEKIVFSRGTHRILPLIVFLDSS
jgi:hypothetical protein